MARRTECDQIGERIHGFPVLSELKSGDDMMDTHPIFQEATHATDVLVALKGSVSLDVPIGTVVTICPALPAMVPFAAVSIPKTLTATEVVGAVLPGEACKGFSAMLTGKGDFLANVKTTFLSYSLTLALLGTKALWAMCLPFGGIGGHKLLPAVIADIRNLFGCSLSRCIGALVRAILSVPVGFVKEDLAASKADILDARNAYLEATEDTTALGRATLLVGNPVCARPVSKWPVADRANRGECVFHHTSDGMNRSGKRGTFLGTNACRQVAILPKPHVKYISEQGFCKGGYIV